MDHPGTILPSSDVVAAAREWIDAAAPRWRVQILSRRARTGTSGTVDGAPTRIRRFLEGIPWPYVRPAIDYLLSLAPYTGVIANGAELGTAYRPTLTVWQRDSGSAALGAKGANAGDATYTLVQDLIEDGVDDVMSVTTSASCSETVVSDYAWDSPDVEELPRGGMGVTYQIAGLRRNDDGTFDYALVKRVAHTQHTGPVVTESDMLHVVTAETWDNVYVDASGQFCDDSWSVIPGVSAGIAMGDDGSLTETKVLVSGENPDCTVKLTVTRETMKPQTVRESSSYNQFQSTHETERTGQAEPLPDAPYESDGAVQRNESRLRPDGSFDTTVHIERERPVPSASVEVTHGRRGLRRTVRSDNQTDPAGTGDVPVGHAVKVDKTPGGLFNNTVTTFDPNTSSPVGEAYQVDRFHTVHTTVHGATSVNIDAPSSGGGYIRSVETTMDDDGVITKTKRDDHEKTVEKAVESYRVTRTGVVHTVKDVSKASVSRSAIPFSAANVGRSVEYETTPGGHTTVTKVDVNGPSSAAPVSAACKSEALTHETTTESAVAPGSTISESAIHHSASGGTSWNVSISKDDNGACLKRETKIVETDMLAERSFERTPRGVVKTEVQNSTSRSASAPSAVGLSQSSVTPGGRNRLVTRTPVASTGTPDRAYSSRDVFLAVDEAIKTGTTIPARPDLIAGGGTYQTWETSMDSHGFAQAVTRTHQELPQVDAGSRATEDAFSQTHETRFRNCAPEKIESVVTSASSVVPEPPAGGRQLTTVATEMTQGGLYNGTVTVVGPKPFFRDYGFNTPLSRTHVWLFRNQPFSFLSGTLDGSIGSWFSLNHCAPPLSGHSPTSVHVSGHPQINEFGLYDGQIVVEAVWDPVTGGPDNDHWDTASVLMTWSYEMVAANYSIGLSTKPGSGDNYVNVSTIHATYIRRSIVETIASGCRAFMASNFSGKIIEGSHANVTPSTGLVHAVKVASATTRIEISELTGHQTTYDKAWAI